MSFDAAPELSVVVPVLNEEGEISPFLEGLARQREIGFELILSDGGSSDGTVSLARQMAPLLPFPVKVIQGRRGRGAQLNLGSRHAAAGNLLFLHIDSTFPDPLAFRKGVDALVAERSEQGSRVAGHFPLEFGFDSPPPLPYRFYAAKASLDRPGCTHGDQGMLIGADFFQAIGPFAENLPVMEDTTLADRIRKEGRWLLLPSRIRTSPRRFLSEGLLPRQTLNAILMTLMEVGELSLIDLLRDCYRGQQGTTRLRLRPFLERVREGIGALSPDEKRELWRKSGRYVRSNAWQIPFFLDVVFGKTEEGNGGVFLTLHDTLFAALIDNRACDRIATLLVRCWFRFALFTSR